MKKLEGIIISPPSWLENLRPVIHLVFFEIPLVTQLRSHSGVNYLKIWCDTEGDTDRYIFFSITQERLEQYRQQDIPLRDLITESQDGFIYLIDEYQKALTVTVVNLDSIPECYIPAQDSYFDPAGTAEAQDRPTYEIALENQLALEELQKIPHKFTQAYSLLLCLTERTSVNATLVKEAFNAYPWRGGFSRVHFYKRLEHIIPAMLRPQIKSMHFASPGWIELELDKKTAKKVGSLVENYIENADDITDLVNQVNSELSNRKLRGNEGKSISDNISNADLKYCAEAFESVASSLSFKNASLIRELAINDLAALKILLSFQRRLFSLAIFQMQQKANF